MNSENREPKENRNSGSHFDFKILVSFLAGELDKTTALQISSHLFRCEVCREQLALIEKGVEIVKKEKEQLETMIAELPQRFKVWNSLAEALGEAEEELQFLFKEKSQWFNRKGKKIWEWSSKNGLLCAWAIVRYDNAKLNLTFSSKEQELDGTGFYFCTNCSSIPKQNIYFRRSPRVYDEVWATISFPPEEVTYISFVVS